MSQTSSAVVKSSRCSPGPKSRRGQQRRERFLSVATELFLQSGFGATSIDAIVEKAGGSKTTLYSCFPTKEDLFRAVVDATVTNRSDPALNPAAPIRQTLLEYAEHRMSIVLSRQHQQLLRLIAGEAERFPDLGRMYYRRGPQRSQQALTEYFEQLKQQRTGLKQLNSQQAAQSLIGVLLHHAYVRQLFLGNRQPGRRDRELQAAHAVDQVLRGYLPPPAVKQSDPNGKKSAEAQWI